MGAYVGYYRVSTQAQGRSGLGLEAQRQSVECFVRSTGGELVAEFEEVESGARCGRPSLDQALALAKSLRAVLVIAKLDRLARNVSFISRLIEANVEFVAADSPHANKLTIHIMAAMAEYERDQISQRTKLALAAAKRRGKKLGNPRLPEAAMLGTAKRVALANDFAQGIKPWIELAQSSGAETYAAIANYLNQRSVPTQRGRDWTAAGARNIALRLQNLSLI